MDTTETLTDEQKIAAAKNEWGKEFTLGDKVFEVKDLNYFDYIDFVGLVKPLVTAAAQGIEMDSQDGEMKLGFNPANLDYDNIIRLCGKELPRMAGIVCRQSHPEIKDRDVALLARRPQRLIEIILLQVVHNKMIEEFGAFFQRLTGMVMSMVPEVQKVAVPSEIATDSTTEETPSS